MQFHSQTGPQVPGQGRSAATHSAGVGVDERYEKKRFLEYSQMVDAVVGKHLRNHRITNEHDPAAPAHGAKLAVEELELVHDDVEAPGGGRRLGAVPAFPEVAVDEDSAPVLEVLADGLGVLVEGGDGDMGPLFEEAPGPTGVRTAALAAGIELVVPRSRIAREGASLLAALLATER